MFFAKVMKLVLKLCDLNTAVTIDRVEIFYPLGITSTDAISKQLLAQIEIERKWLFQILWTDQVYFTLNGAVTA